MGDGGAGNRRERKEKSRRQVAVAGLLIQFPSTFSSTVNNTSSTMNKALALLLIAQTSNAFSVSSSAVSRATAVSIKQQTRLFNAPRHDVRSGGNVEMDPEEMKIQAALAEHQQNAVSSNMRCKVRCNLQLRVTIALSTSLLSFTVISQSLASQLMLGLWCSIIMDLLSCPRIQKRKLQVFLVVILWQVKGLAL